jgi:hypothetical protein
MALYGDPDLACSRFLLMGTVWHLVQMNYTLGGLCPGKGSILHGIRLHCPSMEHFVGHTIFASHERYGGIGDVCGL